MKTNEVSEREKILFVKYVYHIGEHLSILPFRLKLPHVKWMTGHWHPGS